MVEPVLREPLVKAVNTVFRTEHIPSDDSCPVHFRYGENQVQSTAPVGTRKGEDGKGLGKDVRVRRVWCILARECCIPTSRECCTTHMMLGGFRLTHYMGYKTLLGQHVREFLTQLSDPLLVSVWMCDDDVDIVAFWLASPVAI
jgi:hypothetical protein